jgi:hypothetical protein
MRRVFWALASIVVGVTLVLGTWEAYRRMTLASTSMEVLLAADVDTAAQSNAPIDPKAIEAECRDPEKFAAIVTVLRKQLADIDARSKALMHSEVQVLSEIDKKGKVVSAERGVEHVWYKDGKELRQTIERSDDLKKKPITKFDKSVRESPVVQEVFPFTKENDGYQYTFSGVEEVDGQWRIRIDFAPAGSPVGLFKGQAWIDPLTYEPYRFYGVLAEKKPFLDQFSMLIEYGIAENGQLQTVRSVLDGSGGFAMIQKHIRTEVVLKDYRGKDQGPEDRGH